MIGTIARQGASFGGGSRDIFAVVLIGAFLARYGKDRSVNITVLAADPARRERAEDQVIAFLRRARGLRRPDGNDFDLYSNESLQQTLDELSAVVTAAGLGIYRISLLVGGNRDHEHHAGVGDAADVGDRDSQGGGRETRGHPQTVPPRVGGALGGRGRRRRDAGRGGCGAGPVRHPHPRFPARLAVVLAVGLAAGVGLAFGIYPAARAARLDPVEAMRAE